MAEMYVSEPSERESVTSVREYLSKRFLREWVRGSFISEGTRNTDIEFNPISESQIISPIKWPTPGRQISPTYFYFISVPTFAFKFYLISGKFGVIFICNVLSLWLRVFLTYLYICSVTVISIDVWQYELNFPVCYIVKDGISLFLFLVPHFQPIASSTYNHRLTKCTFKLQFCVSMVRYKRVFQRDWLRRLRWAIAGMDGWSIIRW